jgi:formylglycine-generating enzyme required for sulfatase activity
MPNKTFIFICLFLVNAALSASLVSIDNALTAAETWWGKNCINEQLLRVESVKLIQKDGLPVYYVINAEKEGFVLVSADDNCRPIIGYSEKGHFDYPFTSPEVGEWMDAYATSVVNAINRDISADIPHPLWLELLSGTISDREPDRNIQPMITTTWNQGNPYNALCPVDAAGPGGHVYAGCGAAAMATVMRYWGYPLHGTGSTSYSNPPYGTIWANFGTTLYNWDNMPSLCAEGNLDIALLMYHCAVALHTDFAPDLSTFQTMMFATTMNQYFGYHLPVYRNRSSYNYENWTAMLKQNLDAYHPVVYVAAYTSVSHLFLVDGYQNTDYFHINWCWGGSYDGYYYLDNLNPGGVLYNGGHAAIMDIYPNISIPIAPSSLSVAFTSHTNNNLQWQDNSDNETGFVIQRKTDINGTWSQIATTGVNANSYQDYAIASQTTYYYRTKSVNALGSSSWSNEVYVIPSTIIYPVDLVITRIGNSQVRLDWEASANAAAYRIYQSPVLLPYGDAGWTLIAETSSISRVINPTANWMFYYVTALSSIEMPASFTRVDGGTFNNGTSNVTLSPFYIDKYEVKQDSYLYVMGVNPSNFTGDISRPVEKTTWFNAIEYCNKRSIQEGLVPCYSYGSYGTNPDNWPAGWNTVATNHLNVSCNWTTNGYRLPSEMEWMFAARGGNSTHNYTYSGSNDINTIGWYYSNSGNATHSVATKSANELGTFDMTGNVFEWVWDIYGNYPGGAQNNPHGAGTGTTRISRGGSYRAAEASCTVAYRYSVPPSQVSSYLGFRVCRMAP